MPAHRFSVPISGEDMDRLCANASGVSPAIRTALRDQTRTARLRHGFMSSLTEGEARSFLRYANRQGFERLATALRPIGPEKSGPAPPLLVRPNREAAQEHGMLALTLELGRGDDHSVFHLSMNRLDGGSLD